jgi:tetratricopeptide (TPR) repeat protein
MRGIALNNFGYALEHAGRADESVEVYRRSLAIREKLAAEFPDVPTHRAEVAGGLTNLASALGKKREWAAARGLLDRAVRLYRDARAAAPGVRRYEVDLPSALLARAEASLGLGDHAAAAADAGEVWRAVPPHLADQPKLTFRALRAVRDCVPLARKDDRLPPAQREAVAREYLARVRVMLDEVERPPRDNYVMQVELANELASSELPELRDPGRALRVLERNGQQHPDHVPWKLLAMVRYRNGDWDGAVRATERSLEVRGGNAYAYHHTVLAAAYARKGELGKAREWFARARSAADSGRLEDTPRDLFDEAAALLGSPVTLAETAPPPRPASHQADP